MSGAGELAGSRTFFYRTARIYVTGDDGDEGLGKSVLSSDTLYLFRVESLDQVEVSTVGLSGYL